MNVMRNSGAHILFNQGFLWHPPVCCISGFYIYLKTAVIGKSLHSKNIVRAAHTDEDTPDVCISGGCMIKKDNV